MSKHYGDQRPYQNKEWEDAVTRRITAGLVFLFLVWMMVVAFTQPSAEELIQRQTTEEVTTP